MAGPALVSARAVAPESRRHPGDSRATGDVSRSSRSCEPLPRFVPPEGHPHDERRRSCTCCMIELQPESVVFVRAFLATTVGILVLFVGKALNQRVGALREYNIPEPVTGGLLVAVGLWALYLATGYRVIFELHIRDVLLVYFFTTIGLNARFSDLKAGGRPFVVLCLLVSLFLVLQDALAVALAKVVGWSPSMGLLVLRRRDAGTTRRARHGHAPAAATRSRSIHDAQARSRRRGSVARRRFWDPRDSCVRLPIGRRRAAG
jgi:hypothetical protein